VEGGARHGRPGRLARGAAWLIAVLSMALGSVGYSAVADRALAARALSISSDPETSGRTAPAPCRACRHLPLRESWQIQLSSPPRAPFLHVGMYEVDGFDTPASTVTALHHSFPGRFVVCYIDAGTWENWRPDASAFPKQLLGRADVGWQGERWLDIARFQAALARIMQARTEMCRRKGFDAVDFDNIDGYSNDTGFALTAADQFAYDSFLADTAHQLGLAVALKNDVPQIRELLPYFDFAVDEQCFQYADCLTAQNNGQPGLNAFVAAGKPVFDIEYRPGSAARFCATASWDDFNLIVKHTALDAWRQACPA
jgi:hypothetical protein